MPHGDLSDYAAFSCAAIGIATLAKPALWHSPLGMLNAVPTGDTAVAVRMCGGLFLFMFPVLFVVRWNKINGKAGALGCCIVAATAIANAAGAAGGLAKASGWHAVAAIMGVSALHLAFNANPMETPESLQKKIDEKAAKKKAADDKKK